MAVRTSAGTTLNVLATVPGTYDATGYNALAWGAGNLVGEVVDLGELTLREYNVVTHLAMNSVRATKKKGSYNVPPMTIQLGRDKDDAGQTLLKAALASSADYTFRVMYPDGSKAYFCGPVVSVKTSIGNAGQITGLSVVVEPNTDVLEV